MYTQMCLYMYLSLYIYIHTYTYVYIYMCIYIYIYMHIYIYIYTHTYMPICLIMQFISSHARAAEDLSQAADERDAAVAKLRKLQRDLNQRPN